MFHVEHMKLDLIVIGGGHAGVEAARVAARAGFRVALVTLLRDAIGRMSCNPAIGGLAKGHLVREIDALGGLMAEAADEAGIQFKVLNRSKGPAVQGPRAQCDRDLYAAAVARIVGSEPNLTVVEGSVVSIDGERAVSGVTLDDGTRLAARAVVVTTGTFLRALMHSGESTSSGGRFGEPSAESLSGSLSRFGLRLGRLKTGTPPRIHRASVDYSRMEEAPGDAEPRPFSILTDRIDRPQVLCWLTYTTRQAHEAIVENLHRAPMYSGQITAAGPRYCPSIEDKVVRFADKERHHVFVEPEGLENEWLYLNGISTSLPADVQERVVHAIPGLERAVITRYGYAVEYDFVNPEQLDPSLAVRGVAGLFLAGQINGTSGYEEAAAQGLIAGINAAQFLRGDEPLVVGRSEAYLGVMIDDLVTLGTEEPYRMFTSRAEYRLLLGCDTVYERLSPHAERLGVLDEPRRARIDARERRSSRARREAEAAFLTPERETADLLAEAGVPIAAPSTVARLAQRPGFDPLRLLQAAESRGKLGELTRAWRSLSAEELEGVVSRFRYAGYVEKQLREVERTREDDGRPIPEGFRFLRPGLSREIVEKLEGVRPRTVGQASRIPGVTPAAVSILRLHLREGEGRDGRSLETGALPRAAARMVGEDQPDRT
jgi:tRNA uridine 5-carboxymethylaminomethyl modification enzyme